MRVLVACEFSGIVRDAFRRRGHDAWSNDLLPAEDNGPHLQGDVFEVLTHRKFQRLGTYQQVPSEWDFLIFHWPCTNMCSSGARWFNLKRNEQDRDVTAFVRLATWEAIPCIAGENPIGVLSTRYRKPDQIIQPWMFGHPETKATCLWLKNLPKLELTNDVREEMMKLKPSEQHRVHHASPGPDRWKERSRALKGIAEAMAMQWGGGL